MQFENPIEKINIQSEARVEASALDLTKCNLFDSPSRESRESILVIAQELPLHFQNGHPLLEIRGRQYLLDTGFWDSPNASYAATDSRIIRDLNASSRLIDTEIRGIIGMDLLRNNKLLIDRDAQKMEILSPESQVIGQEIQLESHLTVPVVPIRIGNKTLRATLETGRAGTFLPAGLLKGLPRQEGQYLYELDDDMLRFSADAQRAIIGIGEWSGKLTVGALPKKLDAALKWAGFEAILGANVFSLAPQVILDFENNKIILPSNISKVVRQNNPAPASTPALFGK